MNNKTSMTQSASQLSALLLAWYDAHRRHLPWRAAPGEPADAYLVWLSEIMLQQTTVVTVIPYFEAFRARWPTLADLARASLDEVLHAWQGLGYYARARNLHACARQIEARAGGGFPDNEKDLKSLPGIGSYTAKAIAAIAFGQKTAPVDGNVERVMARFHAIKQPLPKAKAKLARLAGALAPALRPGDHAQALMDLGATVCTPKNPACGFCPWKADCRARAGGTPEGFPRRAPKKAKPTRFGTAFWALGPGGEILLRRRPERGLLGGMMEFPSTEWRDRPWSPAEAAAAAPFPADWQPVAGVVRHTFTHFKLELTVLRADCPRRPETEGIWCPVPGFGTLALPTVMKKVVELALK